MKEMIAKYMSQSMTYEEYRSMTQKLLSQGKTTGPNQSEAMVHYTELAEKRMGRLDKTIKLQEETISYFKNLPSKYNFLVISEPWCGDASQIVPLFHAISEVNPSIDMGIVLRDDNAELMDNFEQNGSRAIPILILVEKETNEVLGSWGARPAPAQVFVDEYKQMDPKPPYEELSVNLQKWYNKDKGVTTQKELVHFVENAIVSVKI